MNRITDAIATMNDKLKNVSPAKVARLAETLTLDAGEIVGWQNAQARAHVEGVLSTDEAQIVYTIIKAWDGQPVAARVVVTQVIAELLKGQIDARADRATAEA